MNEPVNIGWREFERDIKKLAKKLKGNKFTKILAISKGGLIPAYYIAKILKINYVDTACLSSYIGTERDSVKAIKLGSSDEKGWLIIDDIVETGITLEVVKSFYPNAKTAALYIKDSPTKPNFYTKEVIDSWINLPWEK